MNGPKTRNRAGVIALKGDRQARRPLVLRSLPETIKPLVNNLYETARSRRSQINICCCLDGSVRQTALLRVTVAVEKGAILAGRKGPPSGYEMDFGDFTWSLGGRLSCPAATLLPYGN
jgi:hypothetical protein